MNEKEGIIKVLHELEQGYKLGNVDRLTASFYKENVSSIGTAVDEVRVGIEEIRYQFQRDIEQTPFRDVSLTEPQIFLHGDISYVICNIIFIGETIEGEDFAMKGRCSAMLEKNNGKWLIRHVHISVPDYDISEGNSVPRS
jgi:ketosteroid isomerase-like protein